MGKSKKNTGWAEAKKKCRLNQADIRMAKELGMTPKSLIKNIPSPQQQWKAPVKTWIRDLYENKFGMVLGNEPHKANQPNNHPAHKQHVFSDDHRDRVLDEDLPF
ncbi:hypothetical protein GCM10008983_14420 [Lentibacillus halophilus]|uniref:Uncharacterized protein n=1 Tax=Lentibacillus halophilus TaxID=295065 RepID=A0ABN0Z975_9BACI